MSAPSVDGAISGFCAALLAGNRSTALAYLSPAIQSRVAASPLSRVLGLRSLPSGYLYRIDSESATRAVVTVTYTTSTGSVMDTMTVVSTPGGWRIGAISLGGG